MIFDISTMHLVRPAILRGAAIGAIGGGGYVYHPISVSAFFVFHKHVASLS